MNSITKTDVIKNGSVKGVFAFGKLEDDLRRMILNNELAYDKAITPETALAKNYNISRNSARKALQNLVNEGLLAKIHGRGTFVVPPEKRICSTNKLKILFVIPDYNNIKAENFYDRNLMAGGFEQTIISGSKLDFVDPDNITLTKLLNQYQQGELHGIVWERSNKKFYPIIEKLRDAGLPQVTINRHIANIPSIFFDIEYSLKELMRFLRGIGHRNIAMMDLDEEYEIFSLQHKVFLNELSKNGIKQPEKYLFLATLQPGTMDDAFATIAKIASAVIMPSFVIDEFHAWCTGMGIRISEDISLISLSTKNGLELSGDIPVSAIADPRYKIGRKAVELLEKLNVKQRVSLAPVKLKGEIIIDKTCISPEKILKYA
jgi:DNA-binding LacI/PurR family transcriptional regulator